MTSTRANAREARCGKLKPVRLIVGGKPRVIRDVKVNTETQFEAFYRGCWIVIVEMAARGLDDRQRFALDVRAADGTLIVDTWEYAAEYSREKLLRIALENILSV